MRTENDIMNLIMEKAINDERIRAVALDGSRANKEALHDEYSDFDIVYFVTDIRDFTKDKDWINYFGDILIVQHPTDWYTHPYDYNSHENFQYLIQFSDGNRIDLSLIDIRNIDKENNKEPRIILLNKDNFKELVEINNEEAFYINTPTMMEFNNTCNEFRWLSIYISKGLCREEFYYAKYVYEVLIIKMFMKMISWKIGINSGFNINLGSYNKYLKKFLTKNEMKRLQGIFPNGEYEDIWNKLFDMYDYFHELQIEVAKYFNFEYNETEIKRVRDFLEKRRFQKK